MWSLGRYNRLTDFTQRYHCYMMISRPKAIILHFKRFIVKKTEKGDMIFQKQKANIDLTEELSFSSFCSEEEKHKSKSLYHLCSVVHHVGNEPSSGHYTTCAKRILEEESDDERWVFFDDSEGKMKTIDYVTGDENNQMNCYLALYKIDEEDIRARVLTNNKRQGKGDELESIETFCTKSW